MQNPQVEVNIGQAGISVLLAQKTNNVPTRSEMRAKTPIFLIPSEYTSGESGTKAYNLAMMREIVSGGLVPEHISSPFEYFHELIKNDKTLSSLIEELNQFRSAALVQENRQLIAKKLRIIQDYITKKLNIPKEDRMALVEGVRNNIGSGKKIILRSTTSVEDLAKYPAAGVYESKINQGVPAKGDAQQLIDDFLWVFSQFYTMKAFEERRRQGFAESQSFPGILIQELVDADYSFVIHTRNPNSLDPDEMIIEIVVGLGPALMSGKKQYAGTAHAFSYNSMTGEVKRISYANKSVKVTSQGDQLIYYSQDIFSREDIPSGINLAEFFQVATKIKESKIGNGVDQDIEGVIVLKDFTTEFKIVQSRNQTNVPEPGPETVPLAVKEKKRMILAPDVPIANDLQRHPPLFHVNPNPKSTYNLPWSTNVNLIDLWLQAFVEVVGPGKVIVTPYGSLSYLLRDGQVLWENVKDLDLMFYVAGSKSREEALEFRDTYFDRVIEKFKLLAAAKGIVIAESSAGDIAIVNPITARQYEMKIGNLKVFPLTEVNRGKISRYSSAGFLPWHNYYGDSEAMSALRDLFVVQRELTPEKIITNAEEQYQLSYARAADGKELEEDKSRRIKEMIRMILIIQDRDLHEKVLQLFLRYASGEIESAMAEEMDAIWKELPLPGSEQLHGKIAGIVAEKLLPATLMMERVVNKSTSYQIDSSQPFYYTFSRDPEFKSHSELVAHLIFRAYLQGGKFYGGISQFRGKVIAQLKELIKTAAPGLTDSEIGQQVNRVLEKSYASFSRRGEDPDFRKREAAEPELYKRADLSRMDIIISLIERGLRLTSNDLVLIDHIDMGSVLTLAPLWISSEAYDSEVMRLIHTAADLDEKPSGDRTVAERRVEGDLALAQQIAYAAIQLLLDIKRKRDLSASDAMQILRGDGTAGNSILGQLTNMILLAQEGNPSLVEKLARNRFSDLKRQYKTLRTLEDQGRLQEVYQLSTSGRVVSVLDQMGLQDTSFKYAFAPQTAGVMIQYTEVKGGGWRYYNVGRRPDRKNIDLSKLPDLLNLLEEKVTGTPKVDRPGSPKIDPRQQWFGRANNQIVIFGPVANATENVSRIPPDVLREAIDLYLQTSDGKSWTDMAAQESDWFQELLTAAKDGGMKGRAELRMKATADESAVIAQQAKFLVQNLRTDFIKKKLEALAKDKIVSFTKDESLESVIERLITQEGRNVIQKEYFENLLSRAGSTKILTDLKGAFSGQNEITLNELFQFLTNETNLIVSDGKPVVTDTQRKHLLEQIYPLVLFSFAGIKRKQVGMSYVFHLLGVSLLSIENMVESRIIEEELEQERSQWAMDMVVASLSHDLVEDTEINFYDLQDMKERGILTRKANLRIRSLTKEGELLEDLDIPPELLKQVRSAFKKKVEALNYRDLRLGPKTLVIKYADRQYNLAETYVMADLLQDDKSREFRAKYTKETTGENGFLDQLVYHFKLPANRAWFVRLANQFVAKINAMTGQSNELLPTVEVLKGDVKRIKDAVEKYPSIDAQNKAIERVLHDINFAKEIAAWLNGGYYRGIEQPEPPFEPTKENIAINLAGFYALESGIGVLSERTKKTPLQIMDEIKAGTFPEEDMLLLARFANATWKASQPFRDLARIQRDTFRPATLLTPDELAKDFQQIRDAAIKMKERVVQELSENENGRSELRQEPEKMTDSKLLTLAEELADTPFYDRRPVLASPDRTLVERHLRTLLDSLKTRSDLTKDQIEALRREFYVREYRPASWEQRLWYAIGMRGLLEKKLNQIPRNRPLNLYYEADADVIDRLRSGLIDQDALREIVIKKLVKDGIVGTDEEAAQEFDEAIMDITQNGFTPYESGRHEWGNSFIGHQQIWFLASYFTSIIKNLVKNHNYHPVYIARGAAAFYTLLDAETKLLEETSIPGTVYHFNNQIVGPGAYLFDRAVEIGKRLSDVTSSDRRNNLIISELVKEIERNQDPDFRKWLAERMDEIREMGLLDQRKILWVEEGTQGTVPLVLETVIAYMTRDLPEDERPDQRSLLFYGNEDVHTVFTPYHIGDPGERRIAAALYNEVYDRYKTYPGDPVIPPLIEERPDPLQLTSDNSALRSSSVGIQVQALIFRYYILFNAVFAKAKSKELPPALKISPTLVRAELRNLIDMKPTDPNFHEVMVNAWKLQIPVKIVTEAGHTYEVIPTKYELSGEGRDVAVFVGKFLSSLGRADDSIEYIREASFFFGTAPLRYRKSGYQIDYNRRQNITSKTGDPFILYQFGEPYSPNGYMVHYGVEGVSHVSVPQAILDAKILPGEPGKLSLNERETVRFLTEEFIGHLEKTDAGLDSATMTDVVNFLSQKIWPAIQAVKNTLVARAPAHEGPGAPSPAESAERINFDNLPTDPNNLIKRLEAVKYDLALVAHQHEGFKGRIFWSQASGLNNLTPILDLVIKHLDKKMKGDSSRAGSRAELRATEESISSTEQLKQATARQISQAADQVADVILKSAGIGLEKNEARKEIGTDDISGIVSIISRVSVEQQKELVESISRKVTEKANQDFKERVSQVKTSNLIDSILQISKEQRNDIGQVLNLISNQLNNAGFSGVDSSNENAHQFAQSVVKQIAAIQEVPGVVLSPISTEIAAKAGANDMAYYNRLADAIQSLTEDRNIAFRLKPSFFQEDFLDQLHEFMRTALNLAIASHGKVKVWIVVDSESQQKVLSRLRDVISNELKVQTEERNNVLIATKGHDTLFDLNQASVIVTDEPTLKNGRELHEAQYLNDGDVVKFNDKITLARFLVGAALLGVSDETRGKITNKNNIQFFNDENAVLNLVAYTLQMILVDRAAEVLRERAA